MLKQIIGEMRQQPLIGTVTLAGTALAIFLIMVVVMMQEVKVAPIAPETNRDRFMHARYFHREQVNNSGFGGSGTMSYSLAKRLYGNLEHTDTTAYFSPGTYIAAVGVHGKNPVRVDIRWVDAAYWRVFDFTFLNGSPLTPEEVANHANCAIITQSLARELFGTDEAAGREFLLDHFTRTKVKGVVKDVPTVTSSAYSQIWVPLTQEHTDGYDNFFGNIHATILADSRDNFPAIKEEVHRRLEALNSELKNQGYTMVDHDTPYPQEVLSAMHWSNVSPDYETEARQRTLVYVILLLIPAINLSSMTQSRMRRRVSEIGVRRAFGCTRWGIIRTLLTENLIVTLAGGVLGFLFSVLFAWIAADTLFANMTFSNTSTGLTPAMLLNGSVFLWAMGFCFLLNILTASVPAWRAARLNPVEAIGGLQK